MFAVLFFVAAGAELWAAPKPVTIFAFDDHTIPFKSNLYLTMVSGTKYPGNPVLQHGPAGSPDANRAQFYGSIIRIGEKFRMWYCAEDDATESIATGRSVSFRPAYAESTDGIHWTGPELGLVDYKGNTRNNLLHFTPKPDFSLTEPLYSSVLYEPDGPDPNKRYKMALYGRFYDRKDTGHTKAMSTIYPYFSADGLRWKLCAPFSARGTGAEGERGGVEFRRPAAYRNPGRAWSPCRRVLGTERGHRVTSWIGRARTVA